MNEWCFRPRFCICKAIMGWGQPGLMRWILLWIMPLVQDQSLNLLTSSPVHYHCATDPPHSPTSSMIIYTRQNKFYCTFKSLCTIFLSWMNITASSSCLINCLKQRTSTFTPKPQIPHIVMKMNEWCFRPRFCTVRLYWAGDNLGFTHLYEASEWMNEHMNEWMAWWTNEQMNEWMNEWCSGPRFCSCKAILG